MYAPLGFRNVVLLFCCPAGGLVFISVGGRVCCPPLPSEPVDPQAVVPLSRGPVPVAVALFRGLVSPAWPVVPLSRWPRCPVARFPLSRCPVLPFSPLSRCPAVPWPSSRCPVVPLAAVMPLLESLRVRGDIFILFLSFSLLC